MDPSRQDSPNLIQPRSRKDTPPRPIHDHHVRPIPHELLIIFYTNINNHNIISIHHHQVYLFYYFYSAILSLLLEELNDFISGFRRMAFIMLPQWAINWICFCDAIDKLMKKFICLLKNQNNFYNQEDKLNIYKIYHDKS